MKERPIIFSDPMIRAILAGHKTQTRRVIKPQPTEESTSPGWYVWRGQNGWRPHDLTSHCPYGILGDHLWVRETWATISLYDVMRPSQLGQTVDLFWRADGVQTRCNHVKPGKWRPSIHMPRWASRIMLEVMGVRVERLQDISMHDALAEGVGEMREHGGHFQDGSYLVGSFRHLWGQINLKRGFSWDHNPWVFVISFRTV